MGSGHMGRSVSSHHHAQESTHNIAVPVTWARQGQGLNSQQTDDPSREQNIGLTES